MARWLAKRVTRPLQHPLLLPQPLLKLHRLPPHQPHPHHQSQTLPMSLLRKRARKFHSGQWQHSACFLCGRLFIFWHCNRESKQLKDHLQSVPVFMDRAQDATAQQAKAEPVEFLQMVKC